MNEDLNDLNTLLNAKSNFFSLSDRKDLLKQMKQMIIDYEIEFLEALQTDLGKPQIEAYASEIAILLNEIDHVHKYIQKWTKPKSKTTVKLGYLEKTKITREAFGSVLIISPWNYPLQLALLPAINAISAGNACVIKPSEYTVATNQLLKKLISVYFAPDQIQIVTGNEQVAQQLIDLNFDFVFFTGSTEVGKKVYHQASKQLKPVVMELGGKNACILDETGFTKWNIKQIIWGKFLNAGQTCIAPDTLFVHESIYRETLKEMKKTLESFYGNSAQNNPDYARIIHQRHFKKLREYLSDGTTYFGGNDDINSLHIDPTILIDVNLDSPLIKEEIFGPIFPVIPYKDLEELLKSDWVQLDSLTTYIFSHSKEHINLLKKYLKSHISVNQVIHHAANKDIPFGGNGHSGFGAYHGATGFKTFSHERTVYSARHYKLNHKKFPPYAQKNLSLVKKFRKWLF